DQLRCVLGDDAFAACVRAWVAEHAGRPADTDDFRRTCEAVTGERLGWFFEQWFLRPGYPVLELEWTHDAARAIVVLTVRQVQERANGVPEVVRAAVDVEVRDAAGATVHRIEIDERVERVELPAPDEPLYVRFDLGSRLVKSVRWSKPLKE